MNDIILITKHDISSAYSCLHYLSNELRKEKKITLWSCTSKENFKRIDDGFNYSFLNCWYGSIKSVRLIFIYFHVFFLMMKKKTDIILNDIDFFPIAYLVKKIKPQKKLVLYHTELYEKDVKTFKYIQDFYEKHANFPDFIIECLNERAIYRKKKYKINKEIFVINNTLPKMNYNVDRLVDLKVQKNKKIVFYAGGCNLDRDLGKFIKELSKVDGIFFLAYCYGNKEELKSVNDMCQKYFINENFKINSAISRTELLKIMHSVDIGIIYYDPEFSINHYYAAPSKFFEYISCGLNVISTNNEGINHIINENGFGICIESGNSISIALSTLLKRGLKDRNEIIDIFNKKYCYEIDSKKTINELKRVLN